MILSALAVASCGGEESDPAFQPGTGSGGQQGPAVSSITVVTSSPTLPSDGSAPVEISAFLRDASNNFVANVPVVFSADSGGLQVTQGTSDTNGLAKASLTTAGDPANRSITVTATAGGSTSSVSVNVSGSRLSVSGPTALALQQRSTYTVALVDSAGAGIANRTVSVSSQRANTLSSSSLTTDANGRATFDLTVTNSGADTVTVSSTGLTATIGVNVNSDAFTFSTPANDAEIALGAVQAVTVRWTQNGTAVVGQPVSFATTRGTLSATSAITNASGDASVNVSSNNAGGAVITATGAGGVTANRPVEFVATTPASIDVQPSLFTVGTDEESTITAVVRDASNNLVKNANVVFTLQDNTGGTLTTASGTTDSQGRTQTVYRAGTTTSAQNGVTITATVQGTAVTDSVSLTVARKEVFISLGTGNSIEEPNAAQYRVVYAVQVTDASGNGVANVPLAMSILSNQYKKGRRVAATAPATGWSTQVTATCADEDANRNGVLDAGEDFNGSTRIEAGNIATVSPRNVTTDANGFAILQVTYPQEYAFYLVVTLEARASVQGTEFARASRFELTGLASDFSNAQVGPPGPVSPFGQAATCTDPN